MKRIHPEFAYQSRELGIQIEDTLGEPPDRKNYQRVVDSLLAEFTKGTEIDDVNLLSFALAEHLQFDDVAGLLAAGQQYEEGDAAKVVKMVSTTHSATAAALTSVFSSDPELARKAIVTAFLFKNGKRWTDEDHSLDALQAEEDKENRENEDEEEMAGTEDIEQLFDSRGEDNA